MENVVQLRDESLPVNERVEAGFPLEPFSDIVILKQIKDEATSSGLILPGKTGEFSCGRVVAVGPGRTYSQEFDATGNTNLAVTVPMKVKVGDFCIFGRYQSGGEPIIIDGEKYILAREGDLGGRTLNGEALKVKLFIEQGH